MFKNFTVLYVEDEEELQKIISSLFTGIFKKSYYALNGKEGLELYTKHKDEIDLIITDINMPKMNGLDMCKHIKEINSSIPIIITTAHNDNSFLNQAIEIGVSKFISKPINVENLFKNIKIVLEPIVLKQQLKLEEELYINKMLEDAKFSVTGKLSAGITHEINTPLTYIKANAEIMGYDIEDLENSKIKTNLTSSLNILLDGIHRIENIVNSMKEMSMQVTANKEVTNVYNTLVVSSTLAWNKFKNLANVYINGEKFNIDTKKDKFNFMANIEVQRMEQVWIIIINNAIDELVKIDNFNDRRLDIDIKEENEFIVITFSDNAGGIKPNILEHIFEPFKGTKSSSGMGVGLSIAKKIIDDHEGATIEVYNNDNISTNTKITSGAVFKIKLLKTKI
ncbi:MAG: hybrid sensor histidine kinase/response regulator [Campylobacterota bacterium]|nr:hybrid sensor histidine kinase/response regulator [Campylobacterota bacterium]